MQGISKRHDRILQLLREQGHVSVSSLSDRLEVSEVTIRKDLQALEDRHLLHRTHGGAHLRSLHVLDRPLQEKAALQAEEKRRIGEAAARHVTDQDAILIGPGTTTVQLAHHLQPPPGLTIVTNALNVALEMGHLEGVEVLVLGGMLRHSTLSIVGPQAEEMLRDLACDHLFLGVGGIDLDYGLTTSNALEAALSQAMIHATRHVTVLADASKFGRRGFRRICGIDDVDGVITDSAVDAAVVDRLEEMGITVEVV